MNPAFFAILLTPLILGFHQVVLGGAPFPDVYSWYKSCFVIVLGTFALMQPKGSNVPPLWLTLPIVLSCLLSKYPDYVWIGFPNQYLGGLAVLALIELAYNPPSTLYITKALVWGSVPVSLFALFPILLPWKLIAWGHPIEFNGNNAASTLYNSNYVGLYAALVLPFLVVKRKYAPAILLAAALIVSRSVSGTLGACVGVGFMLIGEEAWILASLGGLITLLYAAFFWKAGLNGRVDIWLKTLNMISPFGSGLGAYPLEYPQTPGTELVDKPHSMYLQIAHAFGWAGLAAFFVGLLKTRPRSLALTSGIVGFLIAALANDLYIGVAPVAAVMFGASIRNFQKEKSNEPRRNTF